MPSPSIFSASSPNVNPTLAGILISVVAVKFKSLDELMVKSVPSPNIFSPASPNCTKELLPKITSWLKVADPASDMSNVNAVISELLSVPLNIISASPACASIVIFPEEVAIVTAPSPVEISSAATPTPLWKYVFNVVTLVILIVPPSFTSKPSPSATAVVPRAVSPSIKLISAAVVVIVVLAIDNASVSNVPSTSTSPEISNSVAIILSLNVAAPAADISKVNAVIVLPPSLPLIKKSLSETLVSKITSLDELWIRAISVPSSS